MTSEEISWEQVGKPSYWRNRTPEKRSVPTDVYAPVDWYTRKWLPQNDGAEDYAEPNASGTGIDMYDAAWLDDHVIRKTKNGYRGECTHDDCDPRFSHWLPGVRARDRVRVHMERHAMERAGLTVSRFLGGSLVRDYPEDGSPPF